MRMKEKGNKAAGRTGPDDGIGGEWSKINVPMNSRIMVLRDIGGNFDTIRSRRAV